MGVGVGFPAGTGAAGRAGAGMFTGGANLGCAMGCGMGLGCATGCGMERGCTTGAGGAGRGVGLATGAGA